MEWRSIRFDWNRARAFLVTAEEGSFSAAGRALGLAQPTVGRQVAALEDELGVTLFERIGTRLELTRAGLGLIEHVRAMGEAATRVSLAATGQSDSLEGRVSITASQLISAYLLPRAVARLRAAAPGLQVEIVASNDIRDLQRREADIAVRNVAPSRSELVGRRVRDAEAMAYATPAYLEHVGDLSTPAGLRRASFFAFGDAQQMIDYLGGMGLPVRMENFAIYAQDHLVQWEMCRRGLGIAFAMTEVGDTDPGVVRALPDLAPLPVPIWLVAHRELRTNPRVRLAFDVLAEVLGS